MKDAAVECFSARAAGSGTEEVDIMSVRMALAKLCACTCGGALIGGGAVQIADHPPAQVKVHKAKKKVKARSVAYAPVRKVNHLLRYHVWQMAIMKFKLVKATLLFWLHHLFPEMKIRFTE
jgi:hypothetical protein